MEGGASKSEYIDVYTDGSSKNNMGKDSAAGIAFYIPSLKILRSRAIKGTNSIAELVAIDYALWYCKTKLSKEKIHIFSDSMYAINVLSEKVGYKVNKELIEYIFKKIKSLDVKFTHVNGHAGIEYNEMVDKAAKEAIDKQK